MQCDLGDSAKDLQAYFGEMFPREKVRECREKLEKVANLKLYTTPIAMDDLDDVRAALGYERINLLGASYGTFAAMSRSSRLCSVSRYRGEPRELKLAPRAVSRY